MTPLSKGFLKLFVLTLVWLFTAAPSCLAPTFGGGNRPTEVVSLPVPYVQQTDPLRYCVPACILMWRQFKGWLE